MTKIFSNSLNGTIFYNLYIEDDFAYACLTGMDTKYFQPERHKIGLVTGNCIYTKLQPTLFHHEFFKDLKNYVLYYSENTPEVIKSLLDSHNFIVF